ncbi:hypothetical protein ACU686_42085 [Yinghuangia aomiensis]
MVAATPGPAGETFIAATLRTADALHPTMYALGIDIDWAERCFTALTTRQWDHARADSDAPAEHAPPTTTGTARRPRVRRAGRDADPRGPVALPPQHGDPPGAYTRTDSYRLPCARVTAGQSL